MSPTEFELLISSRVQSLRTAADASEFIRVVCKSLKGLFYLQYKNLSLPPLHRLLSTTIFRLCDIFLMKEPLTMEKLKDVGGNIETYLKEISYNIRGLEKLELVDKDECQRVKSALRRCSISFLIESHWILWVPNWVIVAIKMYKSADGYADLKLWKFLHKMKPVEEDMKQSLTTNSAGVNSKFRRKIRHKAPRLKPYMGVR